MRHVSPTDIARHPFYSTQVHHMTSAKRYTLLLLAAAALTAVVGCANGPRDSTAGQYIDDATITTRVKAAIFNEPSLKSAEINVETFKRVVQLSGFVSTQADIQKAVAVTQNVAGVASVKNDMRLK
jgi:osmotically-inducible protein OsmY